MAVERGPQGKIHVPRYQDGCYRGRVTDCCVLCLVRLISVSATTPLRYRTRDARKDDDHDLLGEEVVVPYVERSVPSTELDYREGTIDEIYVTSGNDPGLLTVEIDDGEYVYIDLPQYGRDGDAKA